MMQLIPAIDLMSGKIVRLSRGEAKTAKIYETNSAPHLKLPNGGVMKAQANCTLSI